MDVRNRGLPDCCSKGEIGLKKTVRYFAMQRIGEYKESDVASTLKARDYKDATDLIVIIERDDAASDETEKVGGVY